MCETITKEQLYTLTKSNAEFNQGGGGACARTQPTQKQRWEQWELASPQQSSRGWDHPGWCAQVGRMGLGRTIEPEGEKQKPEDRSTSG